MAINEQLQQRRAVRQQTLQDLSDLTGFALPVISNTLTGKRDSKISTIETLASAMGASFVLVPNHLLPEVSRLMSGKPIGPDDVPSTVERLMRGEE